MNRKTAIAIAAAAAFAVPLAASAQADKPQDRSSATHGNTSSTPMNSGSNTPERATTPKVEGASSGATAQGGFSALDKNHDGYLSRDETRDETWSNRFSELDKDNDGRLSQSEFDAMQAGAGASTPKQ